MDIKTIRKAVMASKGLMKSTTDTKIKEIWNRLDAKTQEAYLEKAKGDKNVASVDIGNMRNNSIRSQGDRESPDVPVQVPVGSAAKGSTANKKRS